MKSIKIFIASPSDVADERRLACHVIKRLQAEYAERVDIQLTMWEQEPLLATADFQSQIGKPSEADIFILIMWSRFGSPLGEEFRRPDGSRYDSATEYEFEEAMRSFGERGQPSILAYRKSTEPHQQSEEHSDQAHRLNRFFRKWFLNEDNTAAAAYHKFSSSVQYEDILDLHLRKLLLDYLPKPNNLPVAASPMIGRESLVRRVSEQVLADQERLIVLVGPGGTGKTRLALHLGHELLESFSDGIFFVSLASVVDPELVPTSIANAIGADEANKAGVAGIVRELKTKQVLLIIDNLEQVQSAGAHIATILSGCQGVKVVVTSRETLKISGARMVAVPPLALPDTSNLPSFADLQQIEAVRLFVSRAQAVRETFELTAENAPDVVDICKRVDALPLAIELAASRIRTLSPARLSQVLDQRFNLLTGGADDLLAHQKSLRELIAWSYDLLTDSERRLWVRLSVFVDGCNIADAQEVCDPNDEYFLDLDVEPLADKSLLNIDPEAAVPRITLLESLRAFAREKLEAHEEFALIQKRFCDWCAGLGFVDEDTATGQGFEQTLERIETEQNNLRSALEFHLSANNAEAALHLCGCLYQYWYTRGLANEGIGWIERALALKSEGQSTNRGRALKGLATLLRGHGRLDEAQQHAMSALEVFTNTGQEGMRATVLCELAAVAQRQGDLKEASGYLEDCIRTAKAAGVSDASMSWFLLVQGVCEHLKGNLALARERYTEGLALSRDAGDKTRTANALLNLGEISETEGDPASAYHHYRESLALWIELKHKQAIARCAEVMAGLELRVRALPYEAAFLLGAAEAIREEIDEPVETYNLEAFNRDVAETKSAMDSDTFQTAWQTGRGLKIEGVFRHVIGNQ